MINYTRMRATAERLIGENGRTMTFTKLGSTPVDPAEPWREDTGADDTAIPVIVLETEFENEDIDGQLVRRGDKKMLVAASALETAAPSGADTDLEDYDQLLDGTTEWKIERVIPTRPGDPRVIYEVHVRK
jgi:hypothetical protein